MNFLVIFRLLRNLRDESDDFDMKIESVVLLGSLANGSGQNVKIDYLVSAGCVPLLLNGNFCELAALGLWHSNRLSD